MRKIRILIAPSAYKGTLSANEIAQAIKLGLERARLDTTIKCLPLADGGDGTIDSVWSSLGGSIVCEQVIGPIGNRVKSYWLKKDNWALLELANCCGLATIGNEPLQPLTANTFGLGQVMLACLNTPCQKMLLGLGGSASTDGGTGALVALGAKFLDNKGNPLPLGGSPLAYLHEIDLSQLDKRLYDRDIEILTDVRSPLLGNKGAANVYSSQKGANCSEIIALEMGLTRLAEVIKTSIALDLRDMPGAGAAGGAAFGLASLLRARIVPGFHRIAELIALEEEIIKSDLVITAEGKLDSQSFNGKATGELASLCLKLNKPLIVFPALIENKIKWQELGITAVCPTTTTNKCGCAEDITRTVSTSLELTFLLANIFNSGAYH